MLIPFSRSLYRIVIGSVDVSSRVAPYLIQVQVVDKAGATSDTATITLDDTRGRFLLPPKGAPVRVYLGKEGRGLVLRFSGVVDSVRSTGDRGGGMRLEISCKSMDTTSGIKEPREKHVDDATLEEAAKKFVTGSGLSRIAIHPSLASKQRPYWAMDGESIIAWGRRVAGELGATFKVQGDVGILVPRSAGISASGKALTGITAQRGVNLISWDMTPDQARPEYQKVVARYYDKDQAKWVEREVEVPGGSGGRTQRTRYDRADEDEADASGDAEGKNIERDKGGGRIDIDGDPLALAEASCALVGARQGVDGDYTIDSVTDTLERGRGYITSLDVVRPKAKGGTSETGDTEDTDAE